MNILLVEDEQHLASTLKEGLEKDGYFVDVADDGSVCVTRAEQHSSDVIIMDVILPVMDGLTTLNTLREKGITTPVILLTAKDAVVNRTDRADDFTGEYPVGRLNLLHLVSRVRALLRHSLQ